MVVTEYGSPVVNERVIWQSPKGWHFDIRATSEPYSDTTSVEPEMIDIVAEADWYRGRLLDNPVSPITVFAHTVFVERPSATARSRWSSST